MKITITRVDQSLPMPTFQTKGAAGFDLYARQAVTIPAQKVGYIPLNVIVQLPANFWVMMAARSSLHKKGLMMINGIGVGDADFRGPQDEYQAALFNFTHEDSVVQKGDRLVQMIILPRQIIELVESSQTEEKGSRGGFGSTG
ncbi:MAG TPA: dUTP diphosphatase [Candidatus Woesebacteria bacterium]|nr:dUTP diphosphatase [Candidatus Woesebacteria bacterium]